jgi:hypothetical protein
VGVWEIGNSASNHFFPARPPEMLSCLGRITSFLSRRAASGPPAGGAAWYNGPVDHKQSGAHHIARPRPNLLSAV